MTKQESGPWGQALTKLAEWDPVWAAACEAMSTNPWRTGVLSAKFVELVSLAVNVACTNLNADGTRRHIRGALAAGATRDEILLVFKCARVMAIHSCSLGAPILLEEAKAAGVTAKPALAGRYASRRQDEGDRTVERRLGAVSRDRPWLDGRVHGDGRRHLRQRGPDAQGGRAPEHRLRRFVHAHVCAGNPPAYPERAESGRFGRGDFRGPQDLRLAGRPGLQSRRLDP